MSDRNREARERDAEERRDDAVAAAESVDHGHSHSGAGAVHEYVNTPYQPGTTVVEESEVVAARKVADDAADAARARHDGTGTDGC